ncbi:MAG: haloacid dehalogenase-like hydrolase [Elusimicrobiota bacterium]
MRSALSWALSAALVFPYPAQAARLAVQALPNAPQGLNAPLVLQPGMSSGSGALGVDLTGSLIGASLPKLWSPTVAGVQPLIQGRTRLADPPVAPAQPASPSRQVLKTPTLEVVRQDGKLTVNGVEVPAAAQVSELSPAEARTQGNAVMDAILGHRPALSSLPVAADPTEGASSLLRPALRSPKSMQEAPAAPEPTLKPGAWLPENRRRIEKLISEHGREERPLAVFDWDNTVIRNDIGEALFYHAIREMRFKFGLGDAFWNVIPKEVGRDEIRANHEAIRHLPLEQAKKTAEYRRYRKLFHLAYEGVKTRKDELGVDFGWLVQLMQGFTVGELEAFTDEVIAFESSRPLGEESISLGDDDPAPAKIRAGIRFYQEMKDLLASLMTAGWDVRIVSATVEWAVARIAARIGIPRENVHGVLARIQDGRLTGELTQKTWDQGKADVILEKTGRRPLLAAGDSNFDLAMLRLSAGERLLIDIGKEPIGSTARREGWIVQPAFPARQGLRVSRDARAGLRRLGRTRPLK